MANQQASDMVRLSDYLTTQQAAEVIGCTDRYVRLLRERGAFGTDVIQVSARSFLLPKKSVDKIANEQHTVGRPRKNSA